MKSYKIKSLFYLGCFLTAAVFYYNVEQKEKTQNAILASQTSELQSEDHPANEDKELLEAHK